MIICGEQYVYLIFIVIMLKLIVSFSFIVNMLKLVVFFKCYCVQSGLNDPGYMYDLCSIQMSMHVIC